MVRIFTLGIIERNGKFLLLKRVNPPKVWSPPGGWLKKGEQPEESLLREIVEESSLVVKIIHPLAVWSVNSGKALGIAYLCRYCSGQVRLNAEHRAFVWKTAKEIAEDIPDCSPPAALYETALTILSCLHD